MSNDPTHILPELQDRARPIDEFARHPKNARQGDLGVIMESLEHHGQYREIIVQKSTGHILAGNHTWEAARQLGWTRIAADVIDVDNTQAQKIVLVDNAANDHAGYDDEQLAELLKDTHYLDGLDGTGFTDEAMEELLARLDDDEEEAEPEEEDESAGVHQIGLIVLCQGDAERDTLMQDLKDQGYTVERLQA